MRKLFFFFLIPPFFRPKQTTMLLSQWKVIDGTGNSWFYADLAVKDGKIVLFKNTSQQRNKKLLMRKVL